MWPRASPAAPALSTICATRRPACCSTPAVDPFPVQRILRHTDPRITTEVYGHLVPGYLRDAINKLPLAGTAALLPVKRDSEEEAPLRPPVVRDLPATKRRPDSASKNLSEIRPSDW